MNNILNSTSEDVYINEETKESNNYFFKKEKEKKNLKRIKSHNDLISDNNNKKTSHTSISTGNFQQLFSPFFSQFTETIHSSHQTDQYTNHLLNKDYDIGHNIDMDSEIHSKNIENNIDDIDGDIELGDLETKSDNNQEKKVNYNLNAFDFNDFNWKKLIKEIIHYYTHFLMFIIFEILFYFNYVVEYEEKLVYKMILNLTEDIQEYLNIDLSTIIKCDFYGQVCENFVNGKSNKENTRIYNDALYLIFGMSGFLLFLIIIETNMFKQKTTFPKEFCKSLLLMIFVGIFDYLFFNYFILKYKIIDMGELLCYLYKHGVGDCNK